MEQADIRLDRLARPKLRPRTTGGKGVRVRLQPAECSGSGNEMRAQHQPVPARGMSRFYERGGRWVLVQSVLMPLVLALGPLSPGVDRTSWMREAALVLLGLGAGIGLGGARVLGRNRTIFPRPNAGSHLIQHGVYALVRHPLYSSVTLLSLAWAGWWASWPTLLASLIQAVFLDLKSRHEEQWLRQQFPGYAEYARRVRRLIPWLY